MFEDSPKYRAMLGAKPILFDDLEPFWEAFCVLTQSRPPALSGAAPIPLHEIAAYCDLFGISRRRDRLEMIQEIRRIDRIYLSAASKARADRTEVSKPKTGPKSAAGRRKRG